MGKSWPLPLAMEVDSNATSTLFGVGGVIPFNLHSQPEKETPLSYPFTDEEVEDQRS